MVVPSSIDFDRNATVALEQLEQARGKETLYKQAVPLLDDSSFILHERLESAVEGTEWIQLSNTATISIIVQPVPDQIDIIQPFDECGDGGEYRDFPPVSLESNSKQYMIDSTFTGFDYFTLEPGESEVFVYSLKCADPGIYSMSIDVPYEYKGHRYISSWKIDYEFVCPNSFTFWKENLIYQNDEFHSEVVKVGNYMWNGLKYVEVQ